MDRNEIETLDFMNVESFSQLPFIRPPPPPREKGAAATAIRLFGKEFGATNDDYSSDENHGEGEAVMGTKELINENTETSNRKFECHYCCRNFPTSQALGGHQNAHKRERQNAKRAHLQSVMVHSGGNLSSFDGLMSYSRLGSSPAAAVPPPFHSWNGGGGPSGGSYYGATTARSSYGAYNVRHHPQPINGSPLGLWRIPAVQTPPSSSSLPPFRQIPALNNPKNEQLKPFSSSSQSRFAFESKPAAMQDHVSLDLRL